MTDEAPWNNTPHSDTRMNRMTVLPNSGTTLSALDKTKHGLFICTATGSGLTVDHVYLCSADGLTLIDLTSIADHSHTTTAGQGGDIVSVYASNSNVCDLWLTQTTDLYEANWASPVYWIRAVTSTGSVANDTDGTTGERSIKLSTGATSGSGSTISYPHMKLNFGQYCMFQTKLRIGTTTSLALHSGVGADDVTAADSNTVKFNAEVCTATNNNWFLRTANGTSNSTSDSGVAMSTSRIAIDIEHDPQAGTPTTYLYTNGTAFSKTTFIPTSGATADNNLIKHSLKNSTAADRTLFTYGSRLIYRITDTWGH